MSFYSGICRPIFIGVLGKNGSQKIGGGGGVCSHPPHPPGYATDAWGISGAAGQQIGMDCGHLCNVLILHIYLVIIVV